MIYMWEMFIIMFFSEAISMSFALIFLILYLCYKFLFMVNKSWMIFTVLLLYIGGIFLILIYLATISKKKHVMNNLFVIPLILMFMSNKFSLKLSIPFNKTIPGFFQFLENNFFLTTLFVMMLVFFFCISLLMSNSKSSVRKL